MSYRHYLMNNAPPVCDGCGKAERGMIEAYWAGGSRHYCAKCWPRHRDFYEDEDGNLLLTEEELWNLQRRGRRTARR